MSKFITIIRPDFMQFCGDACRAAALNHLLFRIAGKSKDQPKEKIQSGDILWYAKTEQITEEMSDAWGVCKVRKEVNALINMGIIGRRVNPEWGADRTKHFSFGQDQCKVFLKYCEEKSICVVHIGLPPEVMHLIYSSNANDKSIKCICLNHQMEPIDVSDANDKYIEAIPIDRPTIDDYKDRDNEGMSLSGESDAPAPITDLQEWKTESGKMRAIKLSEKAIVAKDIVAHDDRRTNNGLDSTGDISATGNRAGRHSTTDSRVAQSVQEGQLNGLAHTGDVDTVRPVRAGSDSVVNSVAPEQTISLIGACDNTVQHSGTPPGILANAGAAQGGKRKKAVTQAKPTFTLTEQQQAFWDLWCNVWFNAEIKPDLTETAYNHTCKLAPYITTDEQINSLIEYTRKDLADSQGIKRKMVQLGNMVYCYAGWKQSQIQPKAKGKPDAYGNDYSIDGLLARQRQQKAM